MHLEIPPFPKQKPIRGDATPGLLPNFRNGVGLPITSPGEILGLGSHWFSRHRLMLGSNGTNPGVPGAPSCKGDQLQAIAGGPVPQQWQLSVQATLIKKIG